MGSTERFISPAISGTMLLFVFFIWLIWCTLLYMDINHQQCLAISDAMSLGWSLSFLVFIHNKYSLESLVMKMMTLEHPSTQLKLSALADNSSGWYWEGVSKKGNIQVMSKFNWLVSHLDITEPFYNLSLQECPILGTNSTILIN